jgi:large subunit ribosomal protein L10|uniref:Large ribosomal subunit protein uL10 n=1 Tax=Schlesneria paludicola TaxID=360056 RepID=A0A7C4LQE4_9PLAN
MSKVVKQMMIADIQAQLGDCREVLVVDVSRIDGVTTNKWRQGLQKKSIRVLGVKNALARRALSAAGLAGINEVLKGPSAIVFGGEDIVALAREIIESAKEVKALEVKGGAIGALSLTAAQVEEISKSPGRRELLGQIAGLALSPGGRLAGAIRGPGGRVAGCVKSLADKGDGEAAA